MAAGPALPLPPPCFRVWIGNVPSKVLINGRLCSFPFEALYVEHCRRHFGCVGGYLADREDLEVVPTMGWLLFHSQQQAVDAALWARATPVCFDSLNLPDGFFRPQPDCVQVSQRVQSSRVRLAEALAAQAEADRRLELAFNGQLGLTSQAFQPLPLSAPQAQPASATAVVTDRAGPQQLAASLEQQQQVEQQQAEKLARPASLPPPLADLPPPPPPPPPPDEDVRPFLLQPAEEEAAAAALPRLAPVKETAMPEAVPPLLTPDRMSMEESEAGEPPLPAEDALPPLPLDPLPGEDLPPLPYQPTLPLGPLSGAALDLEEGGERAGTREPTPDLEGSPLRDGTPDVGSPPGREGTPDLGPLWEAAPAAAGGGGKACRAAEDGPAEQGEFLDQGGTGTEAPVVAEPMPAGAAAAAAGVMALTNAGAAGPQGAAAAGAVGGTGTALGAVGASGDSLLEHKEPLREKARNHLLKALQLPLPAENGEGEKDLAREPADVAGDVERALWDTYGETRKEYLQRVRSLENNLKDNAALRRRVLLGLVAPKRLVVMTSAELAKEELAEEVKRLAEKSLNNSVLEPIVAAKFSTAAALDAKKQAAHQPALEACERELLAWAPTPSPASPSSSSRGASPPLGPAPEVGSADASAEQAQQQQQQQQGGSQTRMLAKGLSPRATTQGYAALSALRPSPVGSTLGGWPAPGAEAGAAPTAAAAPAGPDASARQGQDMNLEDVLAEIEGLQSSIQLPAPTEFGAPLPEQTLPSLMHHSPGYEPGELHQPLQEEPGGQQQLLPLPQHQPQQAVQRQQLLLQGKAEVLGEQSPKQQQQSERLPEPVVQRPLRQARLPSPLLQQQRAERWQQLQQQRQLLAQQAQQQLAEAQAQAQAQVQAVTFEDAPWEPSSPERLQQQEELPPPPPQQLLHQASQVPGSLPMQHPQLQGQLSGPGGAHAQPIAAGPARAEQATALPSALQPGSGKTEEREQPGGLASGVGRGESCRGELGPNSSPKSVDGSSHRSQEQEREKGRGKGRARGRSRSKDRPLARHGSTSPRSRKEKEQARKRSRSRVRRRSSSRGRKQGRHSRSRERRRSKSRERKRSMSRERKRSRGRERKRSRSQERAKRSRGRSPSPQQRKLNGKQRRGEGRRRSRRSHTRSPKVQQRRGREGVGRDSSPPDKQLGDFGRSRGRSTSPPVAKPAAAAAARPQPQPAPWEGLHLDGLPSRGSTPDAFEQEGGLLLADGSAVLPPALAEGEGTRAPRASDFMELPHDLPPHLISTLSAYAQASENIREEAARLLKAFRARQSRSEPLGLWDATSPVYSYAGRTAEELLEFFVKGQLSEDAHVQQLQHSQAALGPPLSFASLLDFLRHLSQHLSLPISLAVVAPGNGRHGGGPVGSASDGAAYLPVDPRRRQQQQNMPNPESVPGTAPAPAVPGVFPSAVPGVFPSAVPGVVPSAVPGVVPSAAPGVVPSAAPGVVPSAAPGVVPSAAPGEVPSAAPGEVPSAAPGEVPSAAPGAVPSAVPGVVPSAAPTGASPAVPAMSTAALGPQQLQQLQQPPCGPPAQPARGALAAPELGLLPLPSLVPFQSANGPSVHMGSKAGAQPANSAGGPPLDEHNLRQLSSALQHQLSSGQAPQPLHFTPQPQPQQQQQQHLPPQPPVVPLGPGQFWSGTLRWQQGSSGSPAVPAAAADPFAVVASHYHPVIKGSEERPVLLRELPVWTERSAEEVVGMLRALKCRNGKQVAWFLLGAAEGGGGHRALQAIAAQSHAAFCEIDTHGQPLRDDKEGWGRVKGWTLYVVPPAEAICSFLGMTPEERRAAVHSLVALALPCWWGWLFTTDIATGGEIRLPFHARGPNFLHHLPKEIWCRIVRRDAVQVPVPKLESNSFLCKVYKSLEALPIFKAMCHQLLQHESALVFTVPQPTRVHATGGAGAEGATRLDLVLWPTDDSEAKHYMSAGIMSDNGTKCSVRVPWVFKPAS